MSFSYDLSDLSTELNRLRLELGDTFEDDYFLDDEEIVQIQSEYTTFFRRAAKCCKVICAKISRNVKFKIGHFSEDSTKVYDRYKDLESKFEVLASVSHPWMRSIYTSDKEAAEADTALVKPKFKLGLTDNEY